MRADVLLERRLRLGSGDHIHDPLRQILAVVDDEVVAVGLSTICGSPVSSTM
jgi:hypothetical protein